MKLLLSTLRAAAAGALAGLVAFAADLALARLTLGLPLPLEARAVAAYLLTGALAGLLLGAWRRRAASAVVFAWALAALYAPALAERAHHALEPRSADFAGAAAALAVVAYGGWIAVLWRLLPTPERLWAAPLLAAATAAAGLALNRNLLGRPLEPASLAADLAVLAAAALVALLWRRHGRRPAVAALLVTIVVAAAAAGLATRQDPRPAPALAADDRPNLVLAVVDTLRLDVFQEVVGRTPEGRGFHDALGGAAWFRNAVAAAPWTAPSMGTILTGLYPREHGFGARGREPLSHLDASLPTLAERLRDDGYRTLAIVTNPLLHPDSGIGRGFDVYEHPARATAKLPLLGALSRLGLYPDELYVGARYVRRRLEGHLDDLADDGRPFFLWLHLMEPHEPLRPHRDLAPDPAAAGLAVNERLYRDEVRHALDELARVFESLRHHGVWERTAVVLVSDHGEVFPSDGRRQRLRRRKKPGRSHGHSHGHDLYPELVRVPLVIRPPGGLDAPRRVRALVSHADLHDTALDLLGVEAPRIGRDRISLAPHVAPEPATAPPKRAWALASGIQRGPRQRALHTRGLKLVHYPRRQQPDELYALGDDPAERRDVAAESPKRLARLRRQLRQVWRGLERPPETRALELDADERRRLEALGYL